MKFSHKEKKKKTAKLKSTKKKKKIKKIQSGRKRERKKKIEDKIQFDTHSISTNLFYTSSIGSHTMEEAAYQFDEIKSKIPTNLEQVTEYIDLIKSKIPTSYDELQPHIEYFKSIKPEDVINDFKNLKVSPITVSVTLVILTTLLIFGKLLGGNGKQHHETPKKKSKKKLTKAQKSNKQIQEILDFVELEYVPEIDKFIETYKSLSSEDIENKFNYFEEMLLKELLKLDAIDVSGNEILRDNRKKVIKFIQDHQKRLDKFKKEIKA